MTFEKLTIGKQEFVLIANRDFQKLAEEAQRQAEDDHWIQAALHAEAKAKSRKEKPIPIEDVESELDALKTLRPSGRRKAR